MNARTLTARLNRTQRGRPRKNPPADAAVRIENAAARGASVIGIARSLRIGKTTLARWLDESPDLREAIERGRERERAALHDVLFKAATKGGNIIAAAMLLKMRHGYREGDQGEQGNRVAIVFNLPGAMTREEWEKAKVIPHDDSANSN